MAAKKSEKGVALKPGVETSEYKEAKSAGFWGVITIILGVIISMGPKFIEVLPQDSKWFVLAGAVISVAGVVQKTLVSAGYISGRVTLKAIKEDK
jgi:hypothetical protein